MIVDNEGNPSVEDLTAAVDSALKAMPPEARAQTDQSIAYVRDLVEKVCKSVKYGDEQWKEVWMAATITLHTLLTALTLQVPEIPKIYMDSVSMEFMLLGSGDQGVEIDGIQLDEENEEE